MPENSRWSERQRRPPDQRRIDHSHPGGVLERFAPERVRYLSTLAPLQGAGDLFTRYRSSSLSLRPPATFSEPFGLSLWKNLPSEEMPVHKRYFSSYSIPALPSNFRSSSTNECLP